MEQRKLDNMTGQDIKEMITEQKINLEDLSIPALNCLFEYESDAVCKGEGDTDLLCRCADVLAQKEGLAEEHDEVFATMLNNAMLSVSPVAQPKTKSYRFKKALLIAAAVVILACSASFVAMAFGFDVFGYFRELISRPAGATIEESGVTLVHFGEPIRYPSIEALVSTEKLNIIYPFKMPEGISVTVVSKVIGINGNGIIEIQTTNDNVCIYIDLSIENTDIAFTDCEKVEKNGIFFYIKKEINTAFAFAIHAGNYYSIQANTYENLIMILDHMKEYSATKEK